jgi:exosome complex RNA-binding protein Rrp42 (RNase PH superfamily)
VKCDLKAPRMARPNEGILHINLDYSPVCGDVVRRKKRSDNRSEMMRIIERLNRESKIIDLETLCVIGGEQVSQYFARYSYFLEFQTNSCKLIYGLVNIE